MASLYIKKLMACFVHLSVYVRAYISLSLAYHDILTIRI